MTLKKKRQNRKGDETKTEIVNATIKVIATMGFENATFENIGLEVGCPKSQVAYHFPKKQVLMTLIMDTIIKAMQQANSEKLKNESNPKLKVEHIIRNTFRWAKENPNQLGTYLAYYKMCATDPDFRASFSMKTEIGTARIYDSLEQAAPTKRISKEARMKVAKAIRHLMVGAIFDFYAANGTTDLAAFRLLEDDVVAAAERLS